MTLFRTACAVVLLFSTALAARAQVGLAFSSERDNYLLFESAPFIVKVTNQGAEPMDFTSEAGHSWLSFIILRVDGSKIRSEAEFLAKERSLQPGESMNLKVNITPYYSLRETGQYTIQAVVKPDGLSSFITPKLVFNVSKGETIWKRDRMVDGKRNTYSLIRFLEDETSCYVRVEEPEENLVLSTLRIGPLLANNTPVAMFDANGELHILHGLAVRTYRYTRVTEDGRIASQEDRMSGVTIPVLTTQPDGSVQLVGGESTIQPHRSSLADDQGMGQIGSKDAPFKAPPGFVAPPLPKK